MNMIIASCGHKLTEEENLGINCTLANYTREGTRCLEYVCYCKRCYDDVVSEGLVLFNEGEENKWLGGK